MPFIILVVVIIGVDNTHVVHQRKSFFYRHAAADMHAQKLVVLHVGFHAGCHHLQRMRLNGNGRQISYPAAILVLRSGMGNSTSLKEVIFSKPRNFIVHLIIKNPAENNSAGFSFHLNYLLKPPASTALRDRLMRPFWSISVTFTTISSPTETTSSTLFTRSVESWEI